MTEGQWEAGPPMVCSDALAVVDPRLASELIARQPVGKGASFKN